MPHVTIQYTANLDPEARIGALCKTLAEIIVAQRDEIAFMQRWLREHNQDVPDADTSHLTMAGMDMKLMPGMLTPAQLKLLDEARGKEFDRSFMEFMIQHHQGAVTMAKAEQASGSSADAKALASSIITSQSAEIEKMRKLLASM